MSSHSVPIQYHLYFNKDGSIVGTDPNLAPSTVNDKVEVCVESLELYLSLEPVIRPRPDPLMFWSSNDQNMDQKIAAADLALAALPKLVREVQIWKWLMETNVTDVSISW
jgi:hypothetical protein